MNIDVCPSLRLLFGLLLVFVLTVEAAQGQVTRPRPKIQLGEVVHHVSGRLEKGTCPTSLKGVKLLLIESWYVRTGIDNTDLVLPKHQEGQRQVLDLLFFTGRRLEQGHLLGRTILTGDLTTFDIQWPEVAFPSRIPWVQNVQDEGRTTTVYRILSLHAEFPPQFTGDVNPVPLIMFFGTETTKNVGTIKINCVSIGG